MKICNRLESIANDVLDEAATTSKKPNYTNRDFFNALIVFQSALMDKMYDMQEREGLSHEARLEMANESGAGLRNLILTYTGLDTHKPELFI